MAKSVKIYGRETYLLEHSVFAENLGLKGMNCRGGSRHTIANALFINIVTWRSKVGIAKSEQTFIVR
jgi:hypothetical protein